MIPINHLLERFKNLTNTDKAKKQLIVEVLTHYKIPATVNQIAIIKNTLYIKAQPIIKTEILFKKEEILEQVQKINGLSTISSIQ